MILPDVLNTMLMGMIFMVVLVTVVRPLVLNAVGNPVYSNSEQEAMLEAVRLELERVAYEEETNAPTKFVTNSCCLNCQRAYNPNPCPNQNPSLNPRCRHLK